MWTEVDLGSKLADICPTWILKDLSNRQYHTFTKLYKQLLFQAYFLLLPGRIYTFASFELCSILVFVIDWLYVVALFVAVRMFVLLLYSVSCISCVFLCVFFVLLFLNNNFIMLVLPLYFFRVG